MKRILRIRDVLALRGYSRSQHYAHIEDGLFTKPVPIGPRAVGHPEDEVEALQQARVRGASEVEIRALVIELESARTGKPAAARRKAQTATADSAAAA